MMLDVCTGYSLAFSVVFCLGTAFSFFSEIIEFDLVESPVLKSCWASHSLLVVMVPMWVLMDLSVMLGSFVPYLFLRVLDLMKIVLDIQNLTTKTKP